MTTLCTFQFFSIHVLRICGFRLLKKKKKKKSWGWTTWLVAWRMTAAPRPTYELRSIADRCISGKAVILFLSGSHVLRSFPWHPHLLSPAISIICYVELMEVLVALVAVGYVTWQLLLQHFFFFTVNEFIFSNGWITKKKKRKILTSANTSLEVFVLLLSCQH